MENKSLPENALRPSQVLGKESVREIRTPEEVRLFLRDYLDSRFGGD